MTFSKTRAHTSRLFRVGSSQISLLFAAECCSRPGHPPPHSGQSAIHTVSPFIGTNLLKAACAFITCQATQVQRSNFALFVFALSLDYCVFIALLNRSTIQRLHLDLGILLFFFFFPRSRIQEGTPSHLYLTAVMSLATCKRSHAIGHHQEPSILRVCRSFSASNFAFKLFDESWCWQPL